MGNFFNKPKAAPQAVANANVNSAIHKGVNGFKAGTGPLNALYNHSNALNHSKLNVSGIISNWEHRFMVAANATKLKPEQNVTVESPPIDGLPSEYDLYYDGEKTMEAKH